MNLLSDKFCQTHCEQTVEVVVGNMMQSVVLDGNPLDEDDGNLLNEVVLDT